MKCIVEGCNCKQNPSGKGYCRKHYDQFRKYGYVTQDLPKNRVEAEGDHAVLIIRKGCIDIARIVFDWEDVDKVKAHCWSLNTNGYVRTFINTSPVYLHRLLMDYSGPEDIDHINRDKHDNRKANLRIVPHYLNCGNRIGKCVKKIVDRNLAKPWCATVITNGKTRLCKYFKTEAEALEAVRQYKQEIGAIIAPLVGAE